MIRIKPMLAYPVSDKPIPYTTEDVYIQPKLDGVRCIIQAEPDFPGQPSLASFTVKAYSRTGKEWKNIKHILDELKPFFFKHRDIILDGELYNHDLRDDFEKIISLVRKQKPTLVDQHEARLLTQFHCYDIYSPEFDYNFSLRDEFIMQAIDGEYEYTKTVETTQCFTESDAKAFHVENLELGYEGSIIRLNTKYQQKRSHSLRKFKDFSDAEATIVGYLDGKGKRTGTLGKFIMQDDEGNQFGCPPGKGYTYKDLADMLSNIHKYMGQRATFTYFERTKAGSYRHPLFKCLRNYE
jgi:DNA ligase-1